MKAQLSNPMLLTLIALILVASLLFGACSSQPNTPTIPPQSPASLSSPTQVSENPSEPKDQLSTTAPKYGGTLRVVFVSTSGTNIGWPADGVNMMPIPVTQCCFETLLRGNNQGKILPWLAESYKVADDQKSITFNLGKGVKFHDGSDFNAEVAKWNLDNFIQASSSGLLPGGPGGGPPPGGPPPPSGGGAPPGAPPSGGSPAGSVISGGPSNWSSVDVIDDYTIRVNIKKWTNTAVNDFADTDKIAFMVSKSSFDKNGIDWMMKNPVGTGPFKFVSNNPDVGMKFVKNSNYWKKDAQSNQLPYLDGIEFIFINDSMTRWMMMKAGEGDWTTVLAAKDAADYAAMNLTVKTTIESNYTLVPDTANSDSPWANQKVREAAEYAIDKETIAKTFGHGYCQAPYQIPPPYSLAYNPNFTITRKYDPVKAKQLLAEAGYANGFKTTIIASPGIDRDVLVAMQDYLSKIGIQVELSFPESGKWISYMGSGTWHNAALYLMMGAMDLNNLGGLQFMFNMLGQSWLRTPEMTQAYSDVLTSNTPDTGLVRKLTDMISNNSLLIPINEIVQGIAVQPYVVANYGERGLPSLWNAEEVWINK
jgi:peptide/nickel transport system substrate-binding protein